MEYTIQGINTVNSSEKDDTWVDKVIEENGNLREVLILKGAIGYKN